MNIGGINGYRQQMALGGGVKAAAGENKALDQDKMALEVANVPRDTKRMAAYLLESGQAKDVDDALDKATNPNFKPKSFGDLLGDKMKG